MLAEDLGDVLGERDVLEEEGTELNRKLKVETSRDKALPRQVQSTFNLEGSP